MKVPQRIPSFQFETANPTTEGDPMRRILIVDDDPHVLFGICQILHGRRAEWEPVLALDTEEACTRLDAAPDIDVLLCDLAMPGGGGIKVLRHAIATDPYISRIVLSGHSYSEDAQQARDLCDRFLEKPCPPSVLQDTIQWAIGRANREQSI